MKKREKTKKSWIGKQIDKWTASHLIAYLYISIDKLLLLFLLLIRQQHYDKVLKITNMSNTL